MGRKINFKWIFLFNLVLINRGLKFNFFKGNLMLFLPLKPQMIKEIGISYLINLKKGLTIIPEGIL